MITLYVKEQGTVLRRTGRRLQVVRGDETLETVRLRDVERVVLLGSVEISAPAMAVLLDAGVETVLLSPSGRFRGRLTPGEGKNVFLRQTQFRRHEDEAFRLRIGRAIVGGKIRNARCVLQRHHRNHPDPVLAEAIERIELARDKVEGQEDLVALLGVE